MYSLKKHQDSEQCAAKDRHEQGARAGGGTHKFNRCGSGFNVAGTIGRSHDRSHDRSHGLNLMVVRCSQSRGSDKVTGSRWERSLALGGSGQSNRRAGTASLDDGQDWGRQCASRTGWAHSLGIVRWVQRAYGRYGTNGYCRNEAITWARDALTHHLARIARVRWVLGIPNGPLKCRASASAIGRNYQEELVSHVVEKDLRHEPVSAPLVWHDSIIMTSIIISTPIMMTGVVVLEYTISA